MSNSAISCIFACKKQNAMNDRDNVFGAYMKEIGGEHPLSAEEEKELTAKIHGGDRRALEKLTRAHLKYVVYVANRYRGRGVDVADLVCEGNVALLKAVRKYDVSQGCRFVSYATPFIRRAIEDAIERQVGLYRVPRDMDTAAERRRARALSADAPLGGRENVTLLSVVADPSSPVPGTEDDIRNDVAEQLAGCLPRLEERERKVMSLLYGIGCDKHTMAEAGAVLGLRRERVRQIRDKAARKLRR